jgi:hypothetical protein
LSRWLDFQDTGSTFTDKVGSQDYEILGPWTLGTSSLDREMPVAALAGTDGWARLSMASVPGTVVEAVFSVADLSADRSVIGFDYDAHAVIVKTSGSVWFGGVAVNNSRVESADGAVTAGEVCHVVGVQGDDSKFHLYIDGAYIGASVGGAGSSFYGGVSSINTKPFGTHTAGLKMQHLLTYDALTATQIAEHARALGVL